MVKQEPHWNPIGTIQEAHRNTTGTPMEQAQEGQGGPVPDTPPNQAGKLEPESQDYIKGFQQVCEFGGLDLEQPPVVPSRLQDRESHWARCRPWTLPSTTMTLETL